MRYRRRVGSRVAALLVAAAASFGVVGCSSDDDSSSSTTSAAPSEKSTTTVAAETLTILVSNDDGVAGEGIAVLVKALEEMPDTEVIVSAPATDQSGQGSKTTPGELTATPTTLVGGAEATAVAGHPADSINWALDGGIEAKPNLVVSGINKGQNIGTFVALSGTVGAARAGAAHGIPALAVSAGLAPEPDYATAAKLAVEWIEEHRSQILDGSMAQTPAAVANLNVPTCSAGTIRGVLDVTVATAGPTNMDPTDCAGQAPTPEPTEDVAAFSAGWATLTPDVGLPAA